MTNKKDKDSANRCGVLFLSKSFFEQLSFFDKNCKISSLYFLALTFICGKGIGYEKDSKKDNDTNAVGISHRESCFYGAKSIGGVIFCRLLS
jgi:hypothetical protein